VTLRAQSEELRRAIAGWHIEGPFLSPEPGFHGAHNPAVMRDPKPQDADVLREITGDDLLLLTLAPEREGALETIRRAVSLNTTVSLGHTNASADRIQQAVNAGATGFTHLGNGCPSLLDRHDNILWRVLECPDLTISLIPDRIHVSPALFRILHRFVNSSRLCYTTDAMAAAAASPGRHRLGAIEVEVGEDRIVRQPGKTNFAGSALRPIEGVFRSAEMLHASWRSTWKSLSITPASFLGLPHGLEPGQPAEFCLVEADEAGRFLGLTVITSP
jgi:N-acetylglucosamine-6-phosphate deacetylase